jgi:hypothetical protein
MSLLMNEDFTLYNLRLGYLNNNHDGVGERLISLNTGVLNEPAFRAAGWTADTAAVKRCYSPPIPTTGAAEYFTRPTRGYGGGVPLSDNAEEQGGMITGHRGSEDTISTNVLNEKEKERRRRKQREKMEEDDSSDLSDDSDDEDTAAQSVKFAKMPIRGARPSPATQVDMKEDEQEAGVGLVGPNVTPKASNVPKPGLMRQPLGRPRRDTTTSSEMSSDNDVPFKRKLPSRPQKNVMLADKIAEEEVEDSDLEDEEDEEYDVEVAEASDLGDDFEDDVAAPSSALLGVNTGTTSSPPHKDISIPPAITPTSTSPKKSLKDQLPKLPRLPSGRPMSVMPTASLLTKALKGDSGVSDGDKAFQRYAELSGKNEASPLWIKIYYSFADKALKPLEVPIRRSKAADAGPPAVSDLIGLALFRYDEEQVKPALKPGDKRVKKWELRMVDDGEVEMDFPALDGAKLVTDFTSNNNRPPQRRARDKPWDEFGLVRAEGADDEDDEDDTALAPVASRASGLSAKTSTTALTTVQSTVPEHQAPPAPPSLVPNRNPITGPSFALAAMRKDSSALLDVPQAPVATSTPRTGDAKTIEIHFTDPQSFQTTLLPVPTTSDTYIAEIFDIACARLRLDKALYVLKVRGTQTVAPSDRTVEALSSNLHLDLVRRRFGAVGDFGMGLSGSPSSNSPNAPLELVPNTPPTAKDGKRKKGFGVLHPNAAQQQALHTTASLMNLANSTMPGRRYNVQRKLPLSFSGSHPRTLVITPEFLQILPSTSEESGPTTGKVTNIHMSSIVGVKVSRKHPKMVRVLVYREKETKRYDFECTSHEEAESIVSDVKVGTES